MTPLLLLSLVFAFISLVTPQEFQNRARIAYSKAELEKFVDHAFSPDALEESNVPGLVISVVKDDKMVFAKGYGVTNASDPTVRPDPFTSLFEAGSVSKSLTATLIMTLWEDGSIERLADNVEDYLPPKDPEDKNVHVPSWGDSPMPMDLFNLLTHTAGFEDRFLGLLTKRTEAIPKDFAEWLVPSPKRVRPPHSLLSYSNHGYGLLGYIASNVTKEAFPDLMRSRIFAKLGMRNSTFAPHDAEDPVIKRMNAAKGRKNDLHRVQNHRRPYRGTPYTLLEPMYITNLPAGSLLSTAADMAQFAIAHINDGKSSDGTNNILQPWNIKRMHEKAYSNHPKLEGMAIGFFERRMPGNVQMVAHAGDTYGQSSMLALFPDDRFGVYMAYNANNVTLRNVFLRQLVLKFWPGAMDYDREAGLADGAVRSAKPAITFIDRAPKYTGVYRLTGRSYSTFESVASLVQQVRITSDPTSGALQMHFSSTLARLSGINLPWALHARGKDLFVALGETIAPGGNLVAFREGEGNDSPCQNVFFSMLGFPYALERAPWYEDARLQIPIATFSLVLSLLPAIFSIPRYLLWRKYGRRIQTSPKVAATDVKAGVTQNVVVSGTDASKTTTTRRRKGKGNATTSDSTVLKSAKLTEPVAPPDAPKVSHQQQLTDWTLYVYIGRSWIHLLHVVLLGLHLQFSGMRLVERVHVSPAVKATFLLPNACIALNGMTVIQLLRGKIGRGGFGRMLQYLVTTVASITFIMWMRYWRMTYEDM